MADQFSDHFGTGGVSAATVDLQVRSHPGIMKGRQRYSRASVILPFSPAFGVGDVARVMQFKSSDRISEIFLSASGATAGAGDIGIYLSGQAHDGAVVEVDIFDAAADLSGGVNRSDLFDLGALTDANRGQTLWEQVSVGAQSFLEDPFEDYDLAITGTTAISVSNAIVLIEVKWVSGD